VLWCKGFNDAIARRRGFAHRAAAASASPLGRRLPHRPLGGGFRIAPWAGLSPADTHSRSPIAGYRNITTRKNQLALSDYQIFLYQVL